MRYLSLLALGLLSACSGGRALTNTPAENNGTYKVSYLFEHDGCKVYRFVDKGTYVYFTNCRGEAVAKTDSTAVQNSTQIVH